MHCFFFQLLCDRNLEQTHIADDILHISFNASPSAKIPSRDQSLFALVVA